MKTIAFAVACLLALSAVLAADSCYQDAARECSHASTNEHPALPNCNAVYGEYGRRGIMTSQLKAYANLTLQRSYEYLLSASYFNNYKTNRVGFSKMFRKLSDHAWEKTIEVIKHITMRGDKLDFSEYSTEDRVNQKSYIVELSELEALASALDTQKDLAERAFLIHREATRNSPHTHDPEIAQYIEKEIIEDQTKTIRNLAGYTNDLKTFIAGNSQDLSLALYFFDEYLQKVI